MAKKAMSTKDIFVTLGKNSWNIPHSVPAGDPTLASMLIVDSQAAGVRNRAQQPFTVSKNIDKVEKSLSYLEQNRTTQSMHQTLNGKFTPLRAEAIERDTERSQLLKDIINTIHTEHVEFCRLAEEIWGQVEKKRVPPSTNQTAIINTIKKDVTGLNTRSEQFIRNATALNSKVELLYNKEVRPAAASVAPPQETPSITQNTPDY